MTSQPEQQNQSIIQRIRESWSALRFGPGGERGVYLALWALVTLAIGFLGLDLKTGLGAWFDVGAGLLLGWIGFWLLVQLTRLGLWLVDRLPRLGLAAALAAYLVVLNFWGLSEEAVWHLSLAIVLGAVLLGLVVHELIHGGWQAAALGKRLLLGAGLLVGIGVNLGLVVWLAYPGTDAHLLGIEPYRGQPSIDAVDPSLPGEYAVQTLTYGSGSDLRRPEYGQQVDLLTEPVNASSYARVKDFNAKARKWYWGFGPETFPLNARVWYPQGEGPFPLVLIVHGNHDMHEFSDPGYAYLGELLASKGYIFVSVDENFLNAFITGGFGGENDARAWLLLKHLEVWEEWNGDPASPFYRRVAMDRIALIGHSRGGEAVAHAAAFNTLSRYPNNAKIRWDFNFGIRSVIAIAPTDQQFKPGGHPTALHDVNYLVLHGAHDGDVKNFVGLRQYHRVTFSDPDSGMFKAALYIYQANHGQFNSVWGRRDLGIPRGQLLNVAPLMPEADQRQIAALMIAAFLDLTLKDEGAYLPIFQDYRNAGDWLPPTLYVNRYEQAGTRYIATFEEDFDVTTTTLPGGQVTTSGLTRWKEDQLEFRTGRDQENYAALLGWNGEQDWFQVTLPPGYAAEAGIEGEAYLLLSLADLRDVDEVEGLLDFTIVLTDGGGGEAAVRLGAVMPLLPQFPVQFTRLPSWEELRYENATEPVLQTFRIPLALFLEANPDLSLTYLRTITLRFDQSASGEIILDDIGFGP